MGGRRSRERQDAVVEGCQAQRLLLQGSHLLLESVHLVLQAGQAIGHLLELVRVPKAVGAAVRGIQARQVEAAAPLTRGLAIALDLAPLALIAAGKREGLETNSV